MKNKSHRQDKIRFMFLPFTKGRINKAFNRSIPRTILYSSISILFFFVVTSSFAAPTTGAVKLPSSKLVKKDKYYCGYIRNKWLPGRLVKKLFLSHVKERSNLIADAKRASGKAKKILLKNADKIKTLIDTRTPLCQPIITKPALRFSFQNSIGVIQRTSATRSLKRKFNRSGSTPSTNLDVVLPNGSLLEAAISGSANIKRIYSAPNGKVYIGFENWVDLEDTSRIPNPTVPGCYIAEIDKSTGIPTCIDKAFRLASILDRSIINRSESDIQLDQSGAVYYAAYSPSQLNSALRKYKDGVTTDLLNDNLSLSAFSVLPDGRVLITGFNRSNNAQWTRRISISGGLTNLYSNTSARFFRLFPDGNVYMGMSYNSAVMKFLTISDNVDFQPWISYNSNTPVYPSDPFCGIGHNSLGFCINSGAEIKSSFITSSNKVYVIAGFNSYGTFMKYYPTLEKPSTIVTTVSTSTVIGDKVALAGLNSSDKNILTLFDTTNDSEIELIGASNEIEIYNLKYSSSQNSIFFDGLRFSDNKYVLGRYDLNTMSFTASETGGTKLVDLQTFN